MLQVSNIRLPINEDENEAITNACRIASVTPAMLKSADINKISVDARRGSISLVYSVLLTLNEGCDEHELAKANGVSLKLKKELIIPEGETLNKTRPIVCGLGPAGLFSALMLARQGARPIVLERGDDIQTRALAVDKFNKTGELDQNSNIQFGEGGAGTFSDGKLVTRIGDDLCDFVTETLLKHGAPSEIGIKAKPHIGTDKLRQVITSIRREIEELGGEVHFRTTLTDVIVSSGKISGVKTTKGDFETDTLILAVGHSARDIFEMLPNHGIILEAKPFSVGFRVEHLQESVDKALYHGAAGHPSLPNGEYQLSAQTGGRGVYTFCMCPGGEVVAASSEDGHLSTNGMSYHARNGKNANSGVVVSVTPDDFGNDPKRAIAFQRELERAAFLKHGGFIAPAENIDSFMNSKGTLKIGNVIPSYPIGVKGADLGALLPDELSTPLRNGIRLFGQKQTGFCDTNAILTGIETRTSSPVRIVRNDDAQSREISGLYPCGEGAGYAGGIVSAAVDGLRVSLKILEKYKFN